MRGPRVCACAYVFVRYVHILCRTWSGTQSTSYFPFSILASCIVRTLRSFIVLNAAFIEIYKSELFKVCAQRAARRVHRMQVKSCMYANTLLRT